MSTTYWINPPQQATANLTDEAKAELTAKGFVQVSFWKWLILSASSKGIEYQVRYDQPDHPDDPADGPKLGRRPDPHGVGVPPLDPGRFRLKSLQRSIRRQPAKDRHPAIQDERDDPENTQSTHKAPDAGDAVEG
jgi:hypothetical protein